MSFVRASSLAFALATSFTAAAHAQTSNKALAEALFQDGRDLLDLGRVSEACAKFAASQRVEAKLGTLMNLAACHEREGKTASAWAEFTEAITQAARAGQPEREQFAREHATALEAHLSRLLLVPADAKPIDVTIDDVAVDRAIVGTAFPVDPGTHVVTVSARGKKSWSQSITIGDGPGTQRLPLPALEDASTPSVVPPPPPERPPIVVERPIAPERRPSRAPYAWTAMAVGAVGVGVGTIFGVRAFTKKSDASHECVADACSQQGLDLWSDAKVSANVATVAFSVAAVAIGIGIYFFATDTSAPPPVAAALRRGVMGVAW